MKKHSSAMLLLLAALALAACSSTPQPEAKQEDRPAQATPKAAIMLTAAQVQAAGIQLGMPTSRLMHRHVTLSGRLVASPESRAEITAAINGTVQKLLVRPGQQVAEQQVVAVLSHPDILRLQEQYLTTRHNLGFLEAEWKRQQALQNEKAGVEKNLQRAEADYKAETARLGSLAGQLRLIGIDPDKLAQHNAPVATIDLRSPIAGTVGQITAALGSLIQPGQPLMSIQSNRRLVAELNVFERDLAVLRTGLGGELRLTQGGGQIPVKITGIGGVMNPDTRAVPVYAEPSQALPANWVAGVSVLAALDAGQQQAAVVPEGALTQQGSDQVLFLSTDGLAFTPVVVTTGASADGLTEIVSPDLSALLINGRKVVVAGAFYVLSHQAVSEGGEE